MVPLQGFWMQLPRKRGTQRSRAHRRYLEGCYESVYNARWSHVVEAPDGEGTGMDVREEEPQHSWTYKAVGDTLEKNNAAQQFGAPRPRLMVLTSEKGWPCSWKWKEDE
ncbi:retrotransposon hot spot (RHS) protein [Trypanosoma cruzi]|nr:retrotransposon hot spot (RHS) protein [Trypanosoma cruzi]